MLEFHTNAVTEKPMVPFLGWTGCTSSCCYAYDCTWVRAWCGSRNTSFRCAHFRVLEQDPWPNDHAEKCQRRRTSRAETPFTPLTPASSRKYLTHCQLHHVPNSPTHYVPEIHLMQTKISPWKQCYKWWSGFINTLLFHHVAGPQDSEHAHHLEHDFNIKKKKIFFFLGKL